MRTRELSFGEFVREVTNAARLPSGSEPAIAAIIENFARAVMSEAGQGDERRRAAQRDETRAHENVVAAEMNARDDGSTYWLDADADELDRVQEATEALYSANDTTGRVWDLTPRFSIVISHSHGPTSLPMCLLLAAETYRWHATERKRTEAPAIIMRALCGLRLARALPDATAIRIAERAKASLRKWVAERSGVPTADVRGTRYSEGFAGIIAAVASALPSGTLSRGGPAEAYALRASMLADQRIVLPEMPR